MRGEVAKGECTVAVASKMALSPPHTAHLIVRTDGGTPPSQRVTFFSPCPLPILGSGDVNCCGWQLAAAPNLTQLVLYLAQRPASCCNMHQKTYKKNPQECNMHLKAEKNHLFFCQAGDQRI